MRRPRFTLRVLVLVVTLVCVYCATWEMTRTHGVDDVTDLHDDVLAAAEAPLVVSTVDIGLYESSFTSSPPLPPSTSPPYMRRWYVWIFGWVVKLPLEQRMDEMVQAVSSQDTYRYRVGSYVELGEATPLLPED